jgi:hypothetical protein
VAVGIGISPLAAISGYPAAARFVTERDRGLDVGVDVGANVNRRSVRAPAD